MSPPIIRFVDPGVPYFRFEYDEAKRAANMKKHGVDPRDVARAFAGLTITELDVRYDYGEERFVTMGLMDGTVFCIGHTESEDGIVRIISARKAEPHEQEIFSRKARNAKR